MNLAVKGSSHGTGFEIHLSAFTVLHLPSVAPPTFKNHIKPGPGGNRHLSLPPHVALGTVHVPHQALRLAVLE